MIETLFTNRLGKHFILNIEQLENTHHSTIYTDYTLFKDSLCLLWYGGILRHVVLLILNDTIPYMAKTGDTLKVMYTKIDGKQFNRLPKYLKLKSHKNIK